MRTLGEISLDLVEDGLSAGRNEILPAGVGWDTMKVGVSTVVGGGQLIGTCAMASMSSLHGDDDDEGEEGEEGELG